MIMAKVLVIGNPEPDYLSLIKAALSDKDIIVREVGISAVDIPLRCNYELLPAVTLEKAFGMNLFRKIKIPVVKHTRRLPGGRLRKHK